MQGHLVGVFGVPDMGPACSDKHVPNFLKNVSWASVKLQMLVRKAAAFHGAYR